MTQPNPGDGSSAAPTNQNPPQDPANGPATQPTPTPPPTPPGFVPATGTDTMAEDDQAQQLLATAVAQDQQGTAQPGGELGDAGKRAIAAEREARKAAEKQIADLTKQMEALKPAADIFAQLRKAAVPEEEKSDTERLQEELAKLREETQTERVQRWRLEIATEKGLTPQQAGRLQGKTRDELAADADALLALFPQATARTSAPQPNGDAAPAPEPTSEPAAQQPAPNGPRPDPSQGARGPVDLNAQIQDALAKGDVKTSIALKQQMRLQQQGNQ